MPKTVEIPTPIRIDKLTEILRIRGVPVYLHWSVLLIAVLILVNVIHHPAGSLLGLAAYISVLLIHESGHLIAAQRMRCEVLSIQLYPLFWDYEIRYTMVKIRSLRHRVGWSHGAGGSRAPHCGLGRSFGYTRFEPINAVLALLGFFSLGVAAVNLLPIAPLDGAIAWAIIPESIKRVRGNRGSRPASWKHR